MAQGRRALSLTEDLVARVERIEADPGPDPGTREHAADEIVDMARAILGRHAGGPLRIFAYGSLIWNPEFEISTCCRTMAHGWHRSFCLRLTRWRGTREQPGLMLALDRGGACGGMLFELPATDPLPQMVRLLERELDGCPPTNVPRWLTLRHDGRPVQALSFVADRRGPAYAGGLDAVEIARITARAAGHYGSAAIYLQRTVAQLEACGIHDRNLWRLQELVAREIRGLG